MLHQFILLFGLLTASVYSFLTFKRVHKQGFHSEERNLSVVFGVAGFGFIVTLVAILQGVDLGSMGLFLTIQEWLVIVGSLLVCHSINERHLKQGVSKC